MGLWWRISKLVQLRRIVGSNTRAFQELRVRTLKLKATATTRKLASRTIRENSSDNMVTPAPMAEQRCGIRSQGVRAHGSRIEVLPRASFE